MNIRSVVNFLTLPKLRRTLDRWEEQVHVGRDRNAPDNFRVQTATNRVVMDGEVDDEELKVVDVLLTEQHMEMNEHAELGLPTLCRTWLSRRLSKGPTRNLTSLWKNRVRGVERGGKGCHDGGGGERHPNDSPGVTCSGRFGPGSRASFSSYVEISWTLKHNKLWRVGLLRKRMERMHREHQDSAEFVLFRPAI